MKSISLVLFVLLSSPFLLAAPTTPHFPEVFLGKCFDRNPVGTDCYSLYGNFSDAAMTDNSLQSDSLYDPFFAIANFSTPKSSILFWSGNMAFALTISSNDPRYVTVEETSTGYILNSLTWCGTPQHTFDYVSECSYLTNTTYYGSQGVWSKASTMFAQGAAGDIFVLLEPNSIGGSPPVYQAFRNGSIFASVELPAMSVERISSITVFLLKSDNAPDERCGEGSLVVLNERVKEKFGYPIICVDDPTTIYSMLCPKNTTKVSAQCLAATLVYNYEVTKNSDDHLTWAIITTATSGVLFVVCLSLILSRVLSSRQRSGS